MIAKELFPMNAAGRGLRIGIAAIGIVVLASCAGKQNESQVVRIGAVLPLTGDSAAWGRQGRWGIESAVQEINTSGGIQGAKLEVVFEDSQAIPRVAVGAISKLINIDHVPAVVGDITSSTSLAMSPIMEQNKVVLMIPTASAPAITTAGAFIFRVWPSDQVEGSELASWMANHKYRRTAILHIATDYGVGLADVFQKGFTAKGGQVVSVQSYGQDENDFKPYLLRVKSENPDSLYLIGYYKDMALALRQAKELGVKVQFFGPTAIESPDLIALAGSTAEGVIYPTIVDFDPANPTPIQSGFIQAFRSTNKTDPDWASSHTHDAVLVLADVMKAGARSGEEIRGAIDRKRKFDGVTGHISFDDNGDVIDKPVMMKTVSGGKFIRLEK